MNTHEGCAGPRAKIGAIVIEAIVGIEAKLGMSAWEYTAQKLKPAGLKWDRHARIHKPYCFRQLASGRWLALNKLYKPLGIASQAYVDYEAYADRAVHFPTDPHELVDVWCSDNGHTLYLHHSDRASLKSYYQRFARLAAVMSPWRTQTAA
jgi:hypothetical protein